MEGTTEVSAAEITLSGIKRCSRCGEEKAITEFHLRKPGGTPRSHCKSCYYAANRPRAQAHAAGRYRYAPPSDSRRAKSRAWLARNPERKAIMVRASKAVERAIRVGTLTRPALCEWCGGTGRGIQAAHKDYSRPLDVLWLCTRCHVKWDHDEPKSLVA